MTFKIGYMEQNVRLQRRSLNRCGFNLDEFGLFDDATGTAVRKFQKDNGRSLDANQYRSI